VPAGFLHLDGMDIAKQQAGSLPAPLPFPLLTYHLQFDSIDTKPAAESRFANVFGKWRHDVE
jgi:hypothetical protein